MTTPWTSEGLSATSSLRKTSCICTLAVVVVVITLTAAQIIYGAVMNSRASTWQIVKGEVETIVVQPRYADVVYSYPYQQERFTGRRLSFLLRGSIAERQHILDTYGVRMKVDVHVNLDDPSESVLEVRAPAIDYMHNSLFIISALTVFSIFPAAILWKQTENAS